MSKMLEEEPELSPEARGMLRDAEILPTRLQTYLDAYLIQAQDHSPVDKQIIRNEAVVSILEDLASSLIRAHFSSEEVERLLGDMHLYNDKCIGLVEDKAAKDGLAWKTARTEAIIKGFALPLSGDLNDTLTPEELSATMDATKKAMLELSNKGISSAEYANTVIEKTIEILRQDDRQFPADRIAQFSKIVEQGKKTAKQWNLSPEENKLIAEATKQSVKEISKFLIDNARIIDSPSFAASVEQYKKDPPVSVRMKASKSVAVGIITDSIKGFNIDAERSKKIMDNLTDSLAGLGESYLKANSAKITAELTKALDQNKSLSARFGLGYTISKGALEKISHSIISTHANNAQELNKALDETKELTAHEIRSAINTLSIFSGQQFDTKELTAVRIAEIRGNNPKAFDSAVTIIKKNKMSQQSKINGIKNEFESRPRSNSVNVR
jgi:hypothetical protein